jgi:cob(I)alamin adenosyltransferase
MKNSSSNITTKKGDVGVTTLADGMRVEKYSPYICALGAVDELNSILGLLVSKDVGSEIRSVLITIQNDLIDVGAELSRPGTVVLPIDSGDYLAQAVRHFGESLPPLKNAVLPGGSELGALFHMARSTCRSVERQIASLEEIDPPASSMRLPYLNHLADLLSIFARVLNRQAGVAEVYWSASVSRIPQAWK